VAADLQDYNSVCLLYVSWIVTSHLYLPQLSHYCHPIVTLLSHCCHLVVTVLAHCCCRHIIVTLLSPFCHPVITSNAVTLLVHCCHCCCYTVAWAEAKEACICRPTPSRLHNSERRANCCPVENCLSEHNCNSSVANPVLFSALWQQCSESDKDKDRKPLPSQGLQVFSWRPFFFSNSLFWREMLLWTALCGITLHYITLVLFRLLDPEKWGSLRSD
jgi:hypothetical protein